MSDLIFKTNYSANDRLSNGLSSSIRRVNVHSVSNPSLSFFSRSTLASRDSRQYIESPYDLYEIGRIIDTESYVSRAFSKKNNLIFKEGYTLQSRNKENLKYVKKRLAEIQYVSKVSFRKLLKEIGYNLIAYSNAYVAKVRKEEASSGRVRRFRGGREVPPVAAWFPLAPETMEVRVKDSGEPKRYRQMLPNGLYREFPAYNITHFSMNKRSGFVMGTPSLVPVKEDILALRRIEESVETLIYKTLFPIIHIQVGSDKNPARMLPNGTSEVDAATALLNNIEDDGGLVTSERVNLEVVGAESRALRVESYLSHFKSRVFAGLGMSGIDFGEGDATGRATGEVLSSELIDSVIEYQHELSEIVARDLFDELLLESGRYRHPYEIPEEDRVRLEFNYVDIERKIKKESHALNIANSGGLTLEEFREEIGKEPLEDSRIEDLMSIKVAKATTKIQTDEQIRAQKAMPKPAAPGGSGATTTRKTKSGNTKTKNTKSGGAANSSKSKTSPKNQYKDFVAELKDALSISDIHRMNLKLDREIRKYIVSDLTNGLIDYKEVESEELDNFVSDMIIDANDSLIKNNSKYTIDKLSNIIARKSSIFSKNI